jgi:transposase
MTPAGPAPDLPDDPATLQRMVRELLAALGAERRQLDQVRARLDHLLRRLYGPKSEKLSNTPSLFDDPPPADTAVSRDPPPDRSPPAKRGHGRRALPRDLPRQRVEHDLSEAEKVCPCCQAPRARIGEEVTERLDYRPSSLFVVVHVRPKYACRGCRGEVAVTPVPPEPVPRAVAAPGLLAHVITAKFADHLPLHRLEGILGRHGIELPRSTMCDWLAGCAAVLRPVYDLLCDRVRRSKVIHTDDTPVPVQDRTRDRTRAGRIWVYVGDSAHPYTVYDATPSRSRDGPQTFLAGFRGFLQADAFGGYDGLYATGAVEVACWAHARRKWYDARDSDPRLAHEALARIRALYDVEDRAKTLTAADRAELRGRESVPLLASLGDWLDGIRPRVLPKSPIGQALTYATNQWAALNVYVTDGGLAIDNNAAERALRGVAVGRKNWLFWGSDRGGRTAAVLTSFTATCRRHRIDPWSYLSDVLTRLPSRPADRLAELLPDAWAGSHRALS